MEKFTLINKDRSRIKVFEPFEDVSKPSPSIDAMMISYGCVYKRSSKPVMKGSRVETIERVDKCKEWTRKAIPKIVLEKTGKQATPEFIEGATNTFALWWMSTYETIIKGGK